MASKIAGNIDKLVNGVELHYESQGSGSHVLLCIPGAMGTARSDYSPQIDYFGSRGDFRIITFDPRGYGSSRPPERKFSGRSTFIEDAKDAKSLMDVLGISNFSVLGWSDGGMSAIILSAMFPDSVTSLVAWGANAYITEEDVKIYRSGEDISLWDRDQAETIETEYGKDVAQKLWSSWVDMTEEVYHNGGNICNDYLNGVNCRTLLLQGLKDPWIPNHHVIDMHKRIEKSLVYCYPDGDHEIHLKDADRFNVVVEDFLKGKSIEWKSTELLGTHVYTC